jgi:hypothetical protein
MFVTTPAGGKEQKFIFSQLWIVVVKPPDVGMVDGS